MSILHFNIFSESCDPVQLYLYQRNIQCQKKFMQTEFFSNIKGNKNTYCLNQYYNTCCYIASFMSTKPLDVFGYAYFCHVFWMASCEVRDGTYWHQTLYIRGVFTRITWVKTSVRNIYCAIFLSTTNTGHHAFIL